MSIWNHAEGTVQGELTGANPAESLYTISLHNIRLTRVEWMDELTVRFVCSRLDRKIIEQICQKRGDTVRFTREKGIFFQCRKLLARRILTGGFLLLFLLTLLLPTRVLFFRVEGNERIPSRKILAAAEECGLRFGVSRRAVRSEKMKNTLLAAMPGLKWAGINTSGCTAVIAVREGENREEKIASTGVSSIVAARDGYITSCTVTRGNGLCTPGQVVREGQVLISGYTDCGICIQVTEAKGEVYAETIRNFQAVTPTEYLTRREKESVSCCVSLVLGKKRINLWKDSGICDATCGRMYEEYYITLPGGFRLPVCLCIETRTQWKTTVTELPQEYLEEKLKEFARNTILDHMVAGSILREAQTVTQEEGRYALQSRFLCSEMIGRVITEEIGETNGKTD